MSNTGPHPLRRKHLPNICGTAVNEPNAPQALIGGHGPEHAHNLAWGRVDHRTLYLAAQTTKTMSPTSIDDSYTAWKTDGIIARLVYAACTTATANSATAG